MKEFKEIILTFIIYFLPIIPILLFEPITIGTNKDIYKLWQENYFSFIGILLFYSYLYVSNKIAKWLLNN